MKIEENPFFVLGVSPDASRIEIEREAQKLLGMLELGFVDAQSYATPAGPQPRTSELVRAAVAALRDPYKRLVAELWARHAPPPIAGDVEEPAEPPPGAPRSGGRPGHPLAGLRRALGWRP